MYPLKFHPIPKSMIWGGDKLCQYKTIDTDQMNIGESWELSGVPGNESVVSNGEFAGRTVIELINEYGPDLLGSRVYETYGDKFPLLVKFIDARDDLSIQLNETIPSVNVDHYWQRGNFSVCYCASQYVNRVS